MSEKKENLDDIDPFFWLLMGLIGCKWRHFFISLKTIKDKWLISHFKKQTCSANRIECRGRSIVYFVWIECDLDECKDFQCNNRLNVRNPAFKKLKR